MNQDEILNEVVRQIREAIDQVNRDHPQAKAQYPVTVTIEPVEPE